MRTMIFGDVASGKSTFAEQLGALTDTSVVHLDAIMQEVGRGNANAVRSQIIEAADADNWIIEGNAFTKDPTYRIERAESILVFDFNPYRALAAHAARSYRIALGKETPAGGHSGNLNLAYYVPYVLRHFPERKARAMNHAEQLGKSVTRFTNRTQARQFLSQVERTASEQ